MRKPIHIVNPPNLAVVILDEHPWIAISVPRQDVDADVRAGDRVLITIDTANWKRVKGKVVVCDHDNGVVIGLVRR